MDINMDDSSEKAASGIEVSNLEDENISKKGELDDENDCSVSCKLDLTAGEGKNVADALGQCLKGKSESVEGSTSVRGDLDGSGNPRIGKEFDNDEQAYDFYNAYAWKVGFSVRKGKLERTRKGIIRERRFVCSCEGYKKPDNRVQNVKRERAHTRTGCLARMVIKLQKGIWRITDFEESHNHHLETPSNVFKLRSHKKTKDALIGRISTMDMLRIHPSFSNDHHCEETKGQENISFANVGCNNSLRSTCTAEVGQREVQNVFDYLMYKQLKDPFLFYAVQVDSEDKLTNFFWVDGKSIIDYSYFGDVICFDMTYQTNKHGRLFAPFIGVNHHMQTILFGVGLLLDETVESFIWLFQTFLKAMSGRAPKSILTDQNAHMAKAISVVMPQTQHRVCLWHISISAVDHLNDACTKQFMERFKSIIYGLETEDEFVLGWQQLLKEFGLEDNDWMQHLFDSRKQWSLAYQRDYFCANMSSIQWNVTLNKFLKSFFKREYNIWRFLEGYEKALEHQWANEVDEDFKSRKTSPVLWADVVMLEQIAKVYTRNVYVMFEEEYKKWIACDCDIVEAVGNTFVYKVTEEAKADVHFVTFDTENETVFCSCKKFEFLGIQCRHVVKVLMTRKIRTLPTQYILKRWTIYAKSMSSSEIDELGGEKIIGSRYSDLCHKSFKLAAKAAESETTTLLVSRTLNKLSDQVEKILKGDIDESITASLCFHDVLENHELKGMHVNDASGRGSRVLGVLGKRRRKKSSAQVSQVNRSKKHDEEENDQLVLADKRFDCGPGQTPVVENSQVSQVRAMLLFYFRLCEVVSYFSQYHRMRQTIFSSMHMELSFRIMYLLNLVRMEHTFHCRYENKRKNRCFLEDMTWLFVADIFCGDFGLKDALNLLALVNRNMVNGVETMLVFLEPLTPESHFLRTAG